MARQSKQAASAASEKQLRDQRQTTEKELNAQFRGKLDNLRTHVDHALKGAQVDKAVCSQVDKMFRDADKPTPVSALRPQTSKAKSADIMTALPGRPSLPSHELYEDQQPKTRRAQAKSKVKSRGAQGKQKGLSGRLRSKSKSKSAKKARKSAAKARADAAEAAAE